MRMKELNIDLQTAIDAIRDIERISCDDLRALFNVMASKMNQAKFSDIDLEVIDDMAGFICGEA